MAFQIKNLWNNIKKFFPYVLGIIAGLVIIFRKSPSQDAVEEGKVIGASEARDEVRETLVDKANIQIEKNEEVINRSREALEKARQARENI